MKKKERIVYFYDLLIKAHSKTFEAPKPISIEKALNLIFFDTNAERSMERQHGRKIIYIPDYNWSKDKQSISILLNMSDQDISDPTFSVPKKKMVREIKKNENEGQDFSAHVVIKLPNDESLPALLLLEYSSGLGSKIIESLFSKLISKAKENNPNIFQQNHPDGSVDKHGNPRKYSVDFKFELQGHISKELKNDLEHGKIQSIELITNREKHNYIDTDCYIEEHCKTLVLKAKEDQFIKDKYTKVMNVILNKKDEYNQAKIKFRTCTGMDRTVDFDTNDFKERGYVRREKINSFNSPLKSSYQEICNDIIDQMKQLMEDL